MAHSLPTLADLMTIIPDLFPRRLGENRITKIRCLRLVNKEINQLALTAVKFCEVNLGYGGSSPDAMQLVKLMAGAQLFGLKLILTVISGPGAPTAAQQLSTCTSQMTCLLTGMGKALISVYTLTLTVLHTGAHRRPYSDACMTSAQEKYARQKRVNPSAVLPPASASEVSSFPHLVNPSPTAFDRALCCFACEPDSGHACKEEFGILSKTAFHMMAACVPNLWQLCLLGCCWDAALPAFGASCPKLANFQFEVDEVPISAVQNFGQSLPNLKDITISGRSAQYNEGDIARLGEYMDVCLIAMHDCLSLNKLTLRFPPCMKITCKPQSWALLPANLTELACHCSITSLEPFMAALRNIRVLSLRSRLPGCETLLEILQQFPLLEKLKWVGTLRVVCGDDDLTSGKSLLKQRLCDGNLMLDCNLVFEGSCEQIRDMFAWLPRHLSVQSLSIDFHGGPQGRCLERLPRIFPHVNALWLEGHMDISDVMDMNMEFFAPLASLPRLRSLSLTCKHHTLSSSGLAELCSSLPNITALHLQQRSENSKNRLAQKLDATGKRIDIIYTN